MDVGATLRRARLAQGLEPADLAERTRIRASLITAIEADDFAACGGETFARGHVRTLAQALGLDPEPLVQAMGGTLAPTSAPQEEPDSLDVWELKSRSHVPHHRQRRRGALLILLAVIAFAALWYWQANRAAPEIDPGSLPSVTAQATATVVPEPTPVESESPSPAPAATEPQADATADVVAVPEGSLVIRLDCTATSWVRVSTGGAVLWQGTLRAGESRTVASQTDATVVVGNAAGVRITVGDTVFDALGAPGEVVTRTFTIA